MSMLRGAELLAQSSGMSSSVIWGLIGASFVLEIIVFAVCVALVRKKKRKKNNSP